MAVAAFVLSIVSLLISTSLIIRGQRFSRHANSLPVLTGMFAEHRSNELAAVRHYVAEDLPADLSKGLQSLPLEWRDRVRGLAWFYDNLGALATHDIVDVEPIAGYLGTSVLRSWEKLTPLIDAERKRRHEDVDPLRWQAYFENLVDLIQECPPAQAQRDSAIGG